MSTLDDFNNELQILLQKYHYVLCSVTEKIHQNNSILIEEEIGRVPSRPFISEGVQTVDLEITAFRLRNNE